MTNEEKIKEAEHILNMLETVYDHDEANARVWCLLNNKEFLEIDKKDNSIFWYNPSVKARLLKKYYSIPKYTRSLDACQNIMQDEWGINGIYVIDDTFVCDLRKKKFTFAISSVAIMKFSPLMKTMPIACIHAILQSYIWEIKGE